MSDEARCENCGQIAPAPYLHWDVTGRVYLCKRQSDEARAGGSVGDVEKARELLDKLSDHITEDYDYRGDVCGSSFRSEAEDILAAALQREREGAGRDGERLDWLEAHLPDKLVKEAGYVWVDGIPYANLREAIDNAIQGDAAMRGAGGGGDGVE